MVKRMKEKRGKTDWALSAFHILVHLRE